MANIPPYMQSGYRGLDYAGFPTFVDRDGNVVTQNPDTVSARRPRVAEKAEDFLSSLGVPRSSSRSFFGGAQVGATDPLTRFVGDAGLASLLPVTSTAYGAAKVANQEPDGMIDLALAPLDFYGLRHAYRTARQAPELVELPNTSPAGRSYFQDILKRAQDSQGPIGRQVDVYAPEEYEGMTLMASPNADAGFAITPEGEIVSLVKGADSPIKGVCVKSARGVSSARGRILECV